MCRGMWSSLFIAELQCQLKLQWMTIIIFPLFLSLSLSPWLAVANGLQYECVYQVMEDFPPNSDSSNVVLKSGDRIIQVRLNVEINDYLMQLWSERERERMREREEGKEIDGEKEDERRKGEREIKNSNYYD